MAAVNTRLLLARAMSEKALQQNVMDLLRLRGWLAYHTFDSRKSAPGFPDVIAVHPRTGRLLVAELKTERGKVTAAQERWLQAFRLVWGAEVFVWRPSDWLSGAIEQALSSERAA